MVLRLSIRWVDAGAAVILVGHAVDDRGTGKHGGNPTSDTDWIQACVSNESVEEKAKIIQFVAVIPHGRGKRASCCHMAGPRPATSAV